MGTVYWTKNGQGYLHHREDTGYEGNQSLLLVKSHLNLDFAVSGIGAAGEAVLP